MECLAITTSTGLTASKPGLFLKKSVVLLALRLNVVFIIASANVLLVFYASAI